MDTKKTETREKYYEIVDGPNKDTLFEACKHAYNRTTKPTINFVVAVGYTTPKSDPGCAYVPMAITNTKIIGIEHEDESGKSFSLIGYCKADLYSIGTSNVTYKPYKFKAHYNTKSHNGSITFIS